MKLNIFGKKKKERVSISNKIKFDHTQKYTFEALGIPNKIGADISKAYMLETIKFARAHDNHASKSQSAEVGFKAALKILGKQILTPQEYFAVGYILAASEAKAVEIMGKINTDHESRTGHDHSPDRVKNLIKQKMEEIGKELGAEVVMVDDEERSSKRPAVATVGSDPEINELNKDDKDLFLEHLKDKNEKKRSVN